MHQVGMVKLKTSPFAGTLIVGELVKREKNQTHLKNCITIHYLVSDDNQGNKRIANNYLADHIESEGTWEISDYDILGFRHVDKTERLYLFYQKSLEEYRKDIALKGVF